ncbi:MAG TPA: archease [Gemmatimonadota bacterium]|nr:archease [Gemmatimonadota bacterium]
MIDPVARPLEVVVVGALPCAELIPSDAGIECRSVPSGSRVSGAALVEADVLIVDLDGPIEETGGEGLAVIRCAFDPELPVLIVAVSRDPARAAAALVAGATDFALLPRDRRWLGEAILRERDRRLRWSGSSGEVPETGPERLVVEIPPEGLSFEEYERRVVEHALARSNWNRSRAARELGISRPRLLRKIERHDLVAPLPTPLPSLAMRRGEFREIDHAADVGLDLEGPDPGAILEAAQRGLVQLLFGEAPSLLPTEEREVRLAEDGYAELLKAWCERLYRMIEEQAFVPLDVSVEEHEPAGFRARVRGATLSRDVLAAASELKAVTWHQLAFEPSPGGGWRGRVIFDV